MKFGGNMNNNKAKFSKAEIELLDGGTIKSTDLDLVKGVIQLIIDRGLSANRVEVTALEAGKLVAEYRKACKKEAFGFLSEALKVRPGFIAEETTWKEVGHWLEIAADLAALQ
jgi:hypothetical protein